MSADPNSNFNILLKILRTAKIKHMPKSIKKLETRLHRRENIPQNRAQLIAAVQGEWEEIAQMQFQRLICSITMQNGNICSCK